MLLSMTRFSFEGGHTLSTPDLDRRVAAVFKSAKLIVLIDADPKRTNRSRARRLESDPSHDRRSPEENYASRKSLHAATVIPLEHRQLVEIREQGPGEIDSGPGHDFSESTVAGTAPAETISW